MKTKLLTFAGTLILSSAVIFSGCKGDEVPGPAGPQGEQGPAGPKGNKGTKGEQGEPGNADVVVYQFGSRTFTGHQEYIINDITQGRIDSSLVLAYYNPSTESAGAWYPVPGLGSVGWYETRFYMYQVGDGYSFNVRLLEPDATTAYTEEVTFTKFKIIIAKASEVIEEARVAQVDLNDYNAVKDYYNLSE